MKLLEYGYFWCGGCGDCDYVVVYVGYLVCVDCVMLGDDGGVWFVFVVLGWNVL